LAMSPACFGLRLRQRGRELFDEHYHEILQKEEERERQELRNVAYVALTRGVDSLIVIKKPKSRRFGFLHTTKRGEIPPQERDSDQENEKPLFARQLRYYGKQEFLEEQEYKPNDYEAIYRGEALHKSLEIGFAYVRSRYGLYTDIADLAQIADGARREIEARFKGRFYKEIPFVWGERLGIIDLLIRTDEGYVVVDYKSVQPADESGYLKQVRFYTEAVRNITGEPCQGYLYYIDQNILKKV